VHTCKFKEYVLAYIAKLVIFEMQLVRCSVVESSLTDGGLLQRFCLRGKRKGTGVLQRQHNLIFSTFGVS
jgi:hypothetical protein